MARFFCLFFLFLLNAAHELAAQIDTSSTGVLLSAGVSAGGWRRQDVDRHYFTGSGYTIKVGKRFGPFAAFGSFDQITIDYPNGSTRTAEFFEAGVHMGIPVWSLHYMPYLDVTTGLLATGIEAPGQTVGADLMISAALGFIWAPVKYASLFAEARVGSGLLLKDEDETEEEYEERQRGRMESYRFSAGLRLHF